MSKNNTHSILIYIQIEEFTGISDENIYKYPFEG